MILKNFYNSISNHPFFTFLAGIASVVSLILSIINEKLIYWIIFTLIFIIFLQLLFLIHENSMMIKDTRMIIGEMNTIKLDVFNTEIELVPEMTGDFISKSDLIIVISSICTPEIMENNPSAIVKLQYPSQLKMKFVLGNNIERLRGHSNNTCSFKVPLGSGNEFIGITSINVKSTDEQAFKESSKMIDINVTSDYLEKKINLIKSVPVADVGW